MTAIYEGPDADDVQDEAPAPDDYPEADAPEFDVPALPGLDSPLSALNGGPGLVYSRLLTLKRLAAPLGKDNNFTVERRNAPPEVRYKYRGIDDLYNHLHRLMGQIGILLVPGDVVSVERTVFETPPKWEGGRASRSNHIALVQRFHWIAEDGSSVTVELPGEGMDHGDKGTGKALSMAHKYAIVQSLNLPTGDPDGDAFVTEGTPAVAYAGPRPADGPAPTGQQAAPAQSGAQQPPQRADRPAWDAQPPAVGPEPYQTLAEALAAAEKATPQDAPQVRRRVMATVAAGVLNGGQGNQLLGTLKEKTRPPQ